MSPTRVEAVRVAAIVCLAGSAAVPSLGQAVSGNGAKNESFPSWHWAAGLKQPQESDLQCLRFQEYGCSEIKDRAICERSRDGRKNAYEDLDVYGSPCVWCHDAHCTGTSDALCEPLEYLAHGAPKYFPSFLTPATYVVANCHKEVEVPKLNYNCLLWSEDGCSWIGERNLCIRSRDGREEGVYTGKATSGTPCVWCGGSVCTERSDAKCQSFEYLYNGKDVIYNQWHVPEASIFADCDDFGSPRIVRLGSAPEYEIQFDVEDIQCGGQHYTGSTKCPHGMSCQPRGLNSYCARMPPQSGRFITSGQEVWYQNPRTNMKHLVPPGIDCSHCGCRGNVTLVEQRLITQIPTGTVFDCGMTAAASPGKPTGGRFITDGRQVWWHSEVDDKKHEVPPGSDCSQCGCSDGNLVLVTEKAVNELPTGDDYKCSLSHKMVGIGLAPSAPIGQVGNSALWQTVVLLLIGSAVSLWTCLYAAGIVMKEKPRRKRGVSAEEKAAFIENQSAPPSPVMPMAMVSPAPPALRILGPAVPVEVAPPVTTAVVQDPTHYIEAVPSPGAHVRQVPPRGMALTRTPAGSAQILLPGPRNSPRAMRLMAAGPPLQEQPATSLFDVIDRNHDGAITRDELRQYISANPQQVNRHRSQQNSAVSIRSPQSP